MYKQPYPHVFRPLKIGPVTVKNRIEVAPAVPMLATEDGFVSEALIAYTRELARSGAGIVTVGDSCIDYEFAHEHLNQLNLGDFRIVPGLSRLVQMIEREGAVASIEINHGGRFTAPLMLGGRKPWGPSDIPANTYQQFEGDEGRLPVPVHEMTREEITQVIDEYATAAEHCAQAGFRMIMLHAGHGHMIAQFFSPLSNKRNDCYGGSFENRIRFTQEMLSAIRARVGDRVAIEMRISADEMVDGGLHFDEMIRYVQQIENKIDLVHLSYGNICEPVTSPRQIQPCYVERGINAPFAVEMKKHIHIPVTAIGSITMDMAEELLTDDKVDMVAMMRNFLADRRYVEKHRLGHSSEVRPCIRCDTCTQNTSRFYPVICAVNPLVGRELEMTKVLPAETPRRVVVIGGGIGGMESAIVAAQRGHRVTLFEKSGELGGELLIASAPDFKADLRNYLAYMIRTVHAYDNIELHLNTEATPEAVDTLAPDAIIVAIGSDPFFPPVDGIEKARFAGDYMLGHAEAGNKIVIVGGGHVGLETALFFGKQGKAVTVVDMLPRAQFGQDCNGIAKLALFGQLNECGVQFLGDMNLQAVEDGGAWFMDRNWKKHFLEADDVVIAAGFKPRTEQAERYRALAPDVFFVGDLVNGVGNVKIAVHGAFDAVHRIH